jgi:hypothetical protein
VEEGAQFLVPGAPLEKFILAIVLLGAFFTQPGSRTALGVVIAISTLQSENRRP